MTDMSKITACRERLDRSLAVSGLSSEESIRHLVRSQLTRSPFPGSDEELSKLVINRSEEVHNFVDTMRSASSIYGGSTEDANAAPGSWNMKHDSERFRVMYKEGPQGSPFHTMLAEGYADGPPDVCFCVANEVRLFKKWWPHFRSPPFKVLACSNLTNIRLGEQLSLLRLKSPWPIAHREALLHNITLQFPEEDSIFLLIKAIEEGEAIELSKHGFIDDGIPLPEECVRIGVIGGLVIQKISPTRCYFRFIVSLDLKMKLLPPYVINFITRQLIGACYKLYQKAVNSAKNDEDYSEALKAELYAIVRGEVTLPPPEPSPGALKGQLSSAKESPAVEAPRCSVASRVGSRRVSPEVEIALGMVDQVIGLLRDKKFQKSSHFSANLACTDQESRGKGEEFEEIKSNSFKRLSKIASRLQEKSAALSVKKVNGASGRASGVLAAVKPMKEKQRGILLSISRLYRR